MLKDCHVIIGLAHHEVNPNRLYRLARRKAGTGKAGHHGGRGRNRHGVRTLIIEIIYDGQLGVNGNRNKIRGFGNHIKPRIGNVRICTLSNKEAFEIVMRKGISLLGDGHSVIVDCGLTKERVQRFEDLVRDAHTKLYKFFLKASHDTLLERVRSRDRIHGGDTNVERFEEVFKIVHDKDFKDFIVIETDRLSVEDVANAIIKVVAK